METLSFGELFLIIFKKPIDLALHPLKVVTPLAAEGNISVINLYLRIITCKPELSLTPPRPAASVTATVKIYVVTSLRCW